MDKIFSLISKEEKRQKESLLMIPSENYTYPEVRKAVGSVLMQKYAEGQPLKRYYQGNEFVDQVESICKDRALIAFRLSPDKWSVNVQAHSGSPANLAVYNALLNPGDKIMSMFLPDGGHLSHGWHITASKDSPKGKKITLVSKIFNVEFYHVNPKTKVFDYGQIEKQAKKFKPKLIVSGGTAYPREINHKKLAQIAHKIGAYYLADIAHEAGLVAAKVNSSPFPHADIVSMTTHKTLRGPRGAIIISRKELGDLIDSSVFPGLQGGPHEHTIAGIAIALEKTKLSSFKRYALQVVKNAKLLAEKLNNAGFEVVTGGTDKHLILLDLRNKGVSGWHVSWALEFAGINVNRNTIPMDSASPFYPSGVRLGTPAITARGMKEKDMEKIAGFIIKVVEHVGKRDIPQDPETRKFALSAFKREIENDLLLASIKKEVKSLCSKFPVP